MNTSFNFFSSDALQKKTEQLAYKLLGLGCFFFSFPPIQCTSLMILCWPWAGARTRAMEQCCPRPASSFASITRPGLHYFAQFTACWIAPLLPCCRKSSCWMTTAISVSSSSTGILKLHPQCFLHRLIRPGPWQYMYILDTIHAEVTQNRSCQSVSF